MAKRSGRQRRRPAPKGSPVWPLFLLGGLALAFVVGLIVVNNKPPERAERVDPVERPRIGEARPSAVTGATPSAKPAPPRRAKAPAPSQSEEELVESLALKVVEAEARAYFRRLAVSGVEVERSQVKAFADARMPAVRVETRFHVRLERIARELGASKEAREFVRRQYAQFVTGTSGTGRDAVTEAMIRESLERQMKLDRTMGR